jgi:hypothetical protein
MKKFAQAISLVILASPLIAQADADWRPAGRFTISGTEMSHIGMVAAVMAGLAGYILLRRRHAPTK